jgi:hypothetical protein
MAVPVAIAMAAVAAIGAIAGEISKAKSREEAERLRAKMTAELDKLDSETRDLVSAYTGIKTDPSLREGQMRDLTALDDIVANGGNDAQFRANQEMAAADTSMRARGNREAILSDFEQRGMGGSGFSAAAQLGGAAEQATRARLAGVNQASDASQRALAALEQHGNMSGQVRGQDFSEQAQIAQAKDAIARFNTGNKMAISQMRMGVHTPQDALAQGSQDSADYNRYAQSGAQAIGAVGNYANKSGIDDEAYQAWLKSQGK